MAVVKLAAAVVVYEERVLVVRRSKDENFLPGIWGVPCGKVGSNESAPEAVLRELQEETGLKGDVIGHVGISRFFSFWRGRKVRNVQDNYLVRPQVNPSDTDSSNMPKVSVPKEDQDWKWVQANEIDRAELELDEHNLNTIRQGLVARSAQGPTAR
jgi:8-oxo-dGTP diphosphatase